jgi:pilus assembly protein CpaE
VAISVTLVGALDPSLEDYLRTAGFRTTNITVEELPNLAHPLSVAPDALVLDLRSGQPIPAALAAVKRQHPDTGLIVVAATLDPTLMLEAMRSGVTECVTETNRGQLEAAINRLVAQRVAPVAGEVFVFVGAKGGVGTTTAAVNIATVLSQLGTTLVIDLHVSGGDAALYLGADSHFSVTDAIENTHRLDASFFRGLVTRTKAGPDLLASADRPVTTTVDAPRIRTLIDFATHHYRYTVLDIPRSDVAVLDALQSAAKIIVVANQELATVRGAGRIATMFRQRYGKDKVALVLSRSDREAEIGLEDLQKAVGGVVDHSFPSDYRLALRALNRGQPLVIDSKTPLASSFQAYGRELAGAVSKEPAPVKASGFLGRLAGRRT